MQWHRRVDAVASATTNDKEIVRNPHAPSGYRLRPPICFVLAPRRCPSIACVATPRIWTDGAGNAIRTITRTDS